MAGASVGRHTSQVAQGPAPLLSVENLRVEYEETTAVDDVSFTIARGTVFGLIGPNGAGKTSLMRAIAGLIEPTYGAIHVAGIDLLAEPRHALPHLGFMPDLPPVYADLSVYEFLELFASAHGIPRPQRADRITEMMELVQLQEKRDAPTGGLSRGMKQRLFLAKTLMHDPDLVILDEPASGLDPRARLVLRDIIITLGRRGKAVLVSSHILTEMADFCTSIGVMEAGVLQVSGTLEELVAAGAPGAHYTVRLLDPDPRLAALLDASDACTVDAVDGAVARVLVPGGAPDAARVLRVLVDHGLAVVEFRQEQESLRDVFLSASTGRLS